MRLEETWEDRWDDAMRATADWRKQTATKLTNAVNAYLSVHCPAADQLVDIRSIAERACRSEAAFAYGVE